MYYNPHDPWLSKQPDIIPASLTVLETSLKNASHAASCTTAAAKAGLMQWNAFLVGRAAGKSLQNSLVSLGYDLSSNSWIKTLLLNALKLPGQYRHWWFALLIRDPVHVFIETVLITFVVYLIIMRKKSDWRAQFKDKLNEDETEELLKEWKERGRAPLQPQLVELDSDDTVAPRNVTVHSVTGSFMNLSWIDPNTNSQRTQQVLNFATHDYLGLSSAASSPNMDADPIKQVAKTALLTYGCGSCGPRGFYGTIDAHLDLENDMATFTNTHGGIMYSDGSAGVTSTVAAFAKRGDLILVDEGVYEALGTGVTLSRANVKYFKHNDMQDLRRVMERVRATDISLGRKSNSQKRFIVVEGLYKNHGTICPLDELVKLKHEFCYRLILDESNSFGVLGSTGRGALEYFGLRHMCDAEIVTISLEQSLASVGGVTVGNEEVVDHQRLSGAGYCFSASSPPFLARAAQASLKLLGTEQGVALVDKLHANIEYFYQQLAVHALIQKVLPDTVDVTSTAGLSPIVYFKFMVPEDDSKFLSRKEQCHLWDRVAHICMDQGIMVVSTGRHVGVHLHKKPSPALKVVIMAHHSKEDIDLALQTLGKAMIEIIRPQ